MIEKIAHKLTRKPKLVAAIAVFMLIPSIIGFAATRINYDILSYLPQDLPSSQGEQLLEDPFQMAATSMLVVEGMPAGYTNDLINAIQDIPGVSNAIWVSNLVGIQLPTDMIPADFREMFYSGDSTLMIIQYDHPGASDETMQAIQDVRDVCNEKCFLAGFSVVIKDTRDVMDSELPLFVGLAILLALLYLFAERIWLRKSGFFGALTFLILFGLCNLFAAQQKDALIHRTGAVITASAVTAKSTPASNGTDLFNLHEGTKVEILDDSMRDWKEVKVADGKRGWIQSKQMEII